MLLSVNFHYLGDELYPFGGIYPISTEKFTQQLEKLGEAFEFVSLGDLLQAVKEHKSLPERSCLITFDDGLKCQFDLALPILEKKGIPAAFFVIPQTMTEKKVCNVHKIHKLRAAFEPVEFRKKVDTSLSILFRESIAGLLAGREQEPVQKYRYDNPEQAELKYVLNNVLSEEQKDQLVGVLFSEHFGDEKKMADEIYINLDKAKKLFQKGSLGLHSFSHLSLANLDREKLEKEVVAGKAVLEGLVGGEIEAISYPYGSVYDINTEVIEVCKQAGLRIGLTMERSFNVSLDEPLLFARIDTNDAPGGKSPLFEYGEDGSINILGKMGQKRTLFFKE